MSIDLIPDELKLLPQWVVADADKIPYDPKTGRMANVNDPGTWSDFETAKAKAGNGHPHVGFVLTENDPYTIIDLDAPADSIQEMLHQRILQSFDTYTETSQSGKGYHIVLKGKVPGGARRDRVEIYSNQRYMICTGNAINDSPIRENQSLLESLYKEATKTHGIAPREVATAIELSDQAVVEIAMSSANGDKFTALCRGEWEDLGYPSASEADHALISIFAFYTNDEDQIERLFRMSELGKRDKHLANPSKLKYSLQKVMANSNFAERIHNRLPVPVMKIPKEVTVTKSPAQRAFEQGPPPPIVDHNFRIPRPPGLVGEIADYVYRTAFIPSWTAAIVCGLATVAAIGGRSYDYEDNGLALYMLMLGGTGYGKEGVKNGMDRIFSAIREHVPTVEMFQGRHFGSGQGLLQELQEKPCFYSLIGECSGAFARWSDPRSTHAEKMVRTLLLDLFNKTGPNSVLSGVAYSNKEKSIDSVRAPNVTLIGESVPGRLFESLTTEHIIDGFLPRFTIFEMEVPDQRGRNPHRNEQVPKGLVDRLTELTILALAHNNNGTYTPVGISDGADKCVEDYYCKMQEKIYGDSDLPEAAKELWNRANQRAMRIAAVVAVGCNVTTPVVTEEIATWAQELVTRTTERFAAHCNLGKLDGVMAERPDWVLKTAEKYFTYPNPTPKWRSGLGITDPMWMNSLIPLTFFMRKIPKGTKLWSSDRMSTSQLLDLAFKELAADERLVEVSPQEMAKLGLRARAFKLLDEDGNQRCRP